MDHWPKLHAHLTDKKFVTREDVQSLGIPYSSFVEHAHRIGAQQPVRGIWVPAGATLDARSMAHALERVLGKETILTGGTALFLDGIIDAAPGSIEIAVPLNASPAPREGICYHATSTYKDIRYHRLGDLRVAATPRAMADDAAHTDVNTLCRRIATSHRLRKATVGQFKVELGRRKRFPGRTRFRTAVGMTTNEVAHSGAERLARRLLRAEGLRPLGHPLTIELGGTLIAEIDIPFVDIRYGVEIDGPHHLLPEVASADRARDRKLRRVDWEIDRFWWDEIESRQQWFVQEVNRRIAELSHSR